MLRRAIRVLIAFIVALGLAMPVGVRAMPMAGAMTGMAKAAAGQLCQYCPQPHQTGNTSPDRMPGCQALACISAPAVLPSPALLPARAFLGTTYANPLIAHLAGAEPAPDPFPPRPVVLL
jgi:hypothetical protein